MLRILCRTSVVHGPMSHTRESEPKEIPQNQYHANAHDHTHNHRVPPPSRVNHGDERIDTRHLRQDAAHALIDTREHGLLLCEILAGRIGLSVC